MAEYGREQRSQQSRAVANNTIRSKQLKRIVDQRKDYNLIQREPSDVIIKGKFGELREGTDTWGFNHLILRHYGDFQKHGVKSHEELITIIGKALNDTHFNDIKPSDDERGGWTLDYPLKVYLEKGEEWDIRVVLNKDKSVTTAMPILSESMVDRWDGGVDFYTPLIGVEKTEKKSNSK